VNKVLQLRFDGLLADVVCYVVVLTFLLFPIVKFMLKSNILVLITGLVAVVYIIQLCAVF